MQKSKFCFEIEIEGDITLLVHLLTFDYIILHESNHVHWRNNQYALLPVGITTRLVKAGFLVLDTENDNHLLDCAYAYFGKRKKDVPSHTVFVTNECNLSCPYCFEKVFDTKNQTMTSQQIDQVIDAIRENGGENGLKKILIFGGEPLLPKNKSLICQLFEGIRAFRFRYVEIVTNGIEVPYFYEILKSYRDVVSAVRFTMNGPREIHNRIRDTRNITDTYQKIATAIKLVLNIPAIEINLNLLLDNNNKEMMGMLFDELRTLDILDNDRIHLGFGRTQFACTPDADNYDAEIFIEDYYTALIRLYESDCKRIPLESIQGGEIPMLCEIIKHLVSQRSEELIPDLTPCRAMYPGRLCYYPDGYIYPCTEISGVRKFAVGSFAPRLTWFKFSEEWDTYEYPHKCKSCRYVALCAGGCPVSNLCVNGCITDPYCYNLEQIISNTYKELYKRGYLNGKNED